MKRVFLLFLAAIISVFVFCGCEKEKDVYEEDVYIDRPEGTNVEYWITEPFPGDTDNLSEDHVILYNPFYGSIGFFGKGYKPVLDKDCCQVLEYPEHYVYFGFGDYPVFPYDDICITYVEIADPGVTVYGLTINCTVSELEKLLAEDGFEITNKSESALEAERGRVSVEFTRGKVLIFKADSDTADDIMI